MGMDFLRLDLFSRAPSVCPRLSRQSAQHSPCDGAVAALKTAEREWLLDGGRATRQERATCPDCHELTDTDHQGLCWRVRPEDD